MIVKAKVGLFIAGSDPLFDAYATDAAAKLKLNYDFLAGTGFGAICAAYLAANKTGQLVADLPRIVHRKSPGRRWPWRNFYSESVIENTLDTVAMRSFDKPVLVTCMSTQKFKPEVIDLRRVTDNTLVTEILTANQTLPNYDSKDKLAFDGGILNVYDPMLAMINAGVERIILITSALPVSTSGTALSQAFSTIQHNELIRALCMCQAQSSMLQVHLVVPSSPFLESSASDYFDRKHVEFKSKQAAEAVQAKLANFNVMPPDPVQTGWAAVMALTDLGDRFLTSTGIDLFMYQKRDKK